LKCGDWRIDIDTMAVVQQGGVNLLRSAQCWFQLVDPSVSMLVIRLHG
jgi:hypothetical protein